MKVKLTYFHRSGKYYSGGEYETKDRRALYIIWDEVRKMKNDRTLPGLMVGHSDFIILVDVPDHEHQHPCLII